MPFTWTIGQTNKLKTLNKASFNGLAPARQVSAIVKWIAANNGSTALPTFPITKDKDMALYVEEIGKHLGIYTRHPTFQLSLKPLQGSGDLYKEVIGTHGRVPATLVYEICEKYKIKRDVIALACNNYASPQGSNGIKVLDGHKSYTAELKLLAMGGERVYAKEKSSGKYLFDKIAKHT